jgi:hypothetical protein
MTFLQELSITDDLDKIRKENTIFYKNREKTPNLGENSSF